MYTAPGASFMALDGPAIGVDIEEPFAMAFAYDFRACIADVAQAGGFGGLS